jgi:hypothetical protein
MLFPFVGRSLLCLWCSDLVDKRFMLEPDWRLAVHESPNGLGRVLGYVGENADGMWSVWLNFGEHAGKRLNRKYANPDDAGRFVFEEFKSVDSAISDEAR